MPGIRGRLRRSNRALCETLLGLSSLLAPFEDELPHDVLATEGKSLSSHQVDRAVKYTGMNPHVEGSKRDSCAQIVLSLALSQTLPYN